MKTNEIDWAAYKQGYLACAKHDHNPEHAYNPYERLSDKWKSWNRGWNAYYVHETKNIPK